MGIIEKIEEIREKPEHIRKTYVLFFVAISMVFVIMIWFFSFNAEDSAEIREIIPQEEFNNITQEFNSERESIKNTIDGMKESINQDVINKMQDGNVKNMEKSLNNQ